MSCKGRITKIGLLREVRHKNATREVDPIEIAEKRLRYDFIGEGPKGGVRKAAAFELTGDPNLYNLAFGDLDKDGVAIDAPLR